MVVFGFTISLMKLLACFVFVLIFQLTASDANAMRRAQVLGEETSTDVFPSVPYGAGFILPDSPLYFVDNVYQRLKLAFAFTPSKKIQVRSQILGERLAEARVMESRNQYVGLSRALDEMAGEAELLVKDMNDADANGVDLSSISKEVNDTIAYHREVLKTVGENSQDAVAERVQSTRDSLLASKMSVEDYLPEKYLTEEIENDLEDELDTQVLGVETTTKRLEKTIDRMEKQASKSSEKQFQNEEKQLEKETKKNLKEQRAKLLQELKEKKKRILEERKKKAQEVREAAKQTREAARSLKENKFGTPSGSISPKPKITPPQP